MTLNDLPFELGMQYENWEFDLEPIKSTLYFDKYRYIKNDIKEISGLNVKSINLYFKLDILFKIEIDCFKAAHSNNLTVFIVDTPSI
ncbi:hypothetical protein DNG35_05625 [Mesonia sp. K7]|nr:hypothetical protein DNG35_05625 [Mesonia sp. K7]